MTWWVLVDEVIKEIRGVRLYKADAVDRERDLLKDDQGQTYVRSMLCVSYKHAEARRAIMNAFSRD